MASCLVGDCAEAIQSSLVGLLLEQLVDESLSGDMVTLQCDSLSDVARFRLIRMIPIDSKRVRTLFYSSVALCLDSVLVGIASWTLY